MYRAKYEINAFRKCFVTFCVFEYSRKYKKGFKKVIFLLNLNMEENIANGVSRSDV